MRKDFLETARRHYDIMQKMYSLNTKNSVKKSKIYDETEFLDKSDGKMPQIIVKDSNVSDEIENLLVTFGDKKICVLNFASFTNPGGGFMHGAMAQEEALCHVTNLYNILKEFKSLYDKNKSLKNNGIYKNWAIYSPDVVFDKIYNVTHIENNIDVITCPAPNANVFFSSFGSEEADRYSDILYERCKYVLDIAKENNVKVLCLGAFGCGVFGNNPYFVAECFKILLETKNYDFDVVTFPIPGGDNLEAFKEIFKLKIMFKVKFSNNEIMSFSSKDDILHYVSENWGVQTNQIVIEGKQIFLVEKFRSVFAAIGTIELE